jgi:hypothetical protein
MNNLPIRVHLKSPIAHGVAPSGIWDFPETLPGFDFRPEMLLEHRMKNRSAGAISTITDWPDFGDQPVASFRRSHSGSIAPITNTGYWRRAKRPSVALQDVLIIQPSVII